VETTGARIANLELFRGLPRPKVLEELDRTKALVSTSAKEGMPNVFLEAWARGIPVISLDYDPDGRIVADRLGVVAGGSIDTLRARTEALWRDADLRNELGRNGRDYVRRVHSPEAVAEQWSDLIRSLGAGDGPTS
jgi:glycosyltransferase involved in cell wall biosynthesis